MIYDVRVRCSRKLSYEVLLLEAGKLGVLKGMNVVLFLFRKELIKFWSCGYFLVACNNTLFIFKFLAGFKRG